MTTKEILKGLKYRLDNLKKAQEVIENEKGLEYIKTDYEARIDEIESVYSWIKENE